MSLLFPSNSKQSINSLSVSAQGCSSSYIKGGEGGMLNTDCVASVNVLGEGVAKFSRGGSNPIPLIVKSRLGSTWNVSPSVLSCDGDGIKQTGDVNPERLVAGIELSNEIPWASAISRILSSISSFVNTVIQLNSSFIPPENGAISSSMKNSLSSSSCLSILILTGLNFFFAHGSSSWSCLESEFLRLSDDLLDVAFLQGFKELFLDGFCVFTPLLLLKTPSTNMSAYAGSIFQKPPFPGSFLFLATFTKHLFKDKLWRIEFWKGNKKNSKWN